MRRFASLAVLVLLIAPVSAAEDFTGKWSGSFLATGPDGGTRDDTIFMDLKQKSTELTGTAGPSAEQQWPILKGSVDGNTLAFEVQSNRPLIKFSLTFADGHLKGDAVAEFEGQKLSAKVDAQRVKGSRQRRG